MKTLFALLTLTLTTSTAFSATLTGNAWTKRLEKLEKTRVLCLCTEDLKKNRAGYLDNHESGGVDYLRCTIPGFTNEGQLFSLSYCYDFTVIGK
jgi:hypothetical protein